MSGETVIVTDGNERAALAVVRSLGAAGYRCIVIAEREQSLAGVSRFAERALSAPSPLHSPDVFAECVAKVVRDTHAKLLIPISEASLLSLLPARRAFPACVIPFADEVAFRLISDKQRVLGEAGALGIRVPSQMVVTRETRKQLRLGDLQYPVVVKPARSVGEADGRREKFGVVHAGSGASLQRILGELPPGAFPVLLQQQIVGPGTGIFLLIWDGVVRAAFAHRRLTEKPPSGGVSVDRVSIPLDARLVELSRQLLGRFNWQGVAMVEYKTDQASGTPYLMEINGRFWGSLQLAIDAGVDFPRLLAGLALGGDLRSDHYRVGVRSRWFWGQVDHLIARRPRAGKQTLPAGIISPMRVFSDIVFAPFRTETREEIFRWTDWRPFLHETREWVHHR